MGYVLGIDLGTTWSAAAVGRDGHVEACTLGTTAPAIPSVVVLREDGEILTGETADRRSLTEPTRTAREFKRRLGDPVPIIVGGTPYGAESLMAHLLRSIVADVSAREGEAPELVVLTHPANYTDYKQGLLSEAARLAGLDLARVRLIAEPAAAAVAYARQQRVEPGEVVAVYDFGGGTFDAALVRKSDTGFDLIGTPEGMERLGGIDIDQAVFAHVDTATDGMVTAADSSDPQTRAALARLRDECRKAKEALSTDTDTVIAVSLPNLSTEVRLTREELEGMIRPRISETVDALLRAIDSSGVPRDEVSRVLLVGGSSRMPIVAQVVRELTGRPVAIDAHPKLAIATGAASLVLEQPAAGEAAVPIEPGASTPTGGAAPGVGGIAAAAGLGFAATAAGATIAGVGATSAAAAPGAGAGVAAGVGPPGVAVGPAGVAGPSLGPSGVATPGVGPAGVPTPPAGPGPAAGPPPTAPAGQAGTSTAKAAASGGKRVGLIAAAGAGVVAAVVVVAVVASSGGSGKTSSPTTVAAAPAVVADTSTTVSAAAGVRARGLSGIVTHLAGDGTDSGAGVPGPADMASLGRDPQFAVAPNGDLFVANRNNQVLLVHEGQVSLLHASDNTDNETAYGGIAVGPDGAAYVTTAAGVLRVARDGTTSVVFDRVNAKTGTPSAITFDGVGNMYLADADQRVIRVASDGTVSQVAGTGAQATSANALAGDGGPAVAAPLFVPVALLIDAKGDLLIADRGSRAIRRVGSDGIITTVAGGGTVAGSNQKGGYAADGTKATDLQLGSVDGVAVDAKGRIYVADSPNHVVFRFGSDGASELVIADQSGTVDQYGQPANQTRARNVTDLVLDPTGALDFVQNGTIRRLAGVSS